MNGNLNEDCTSDWYKQGGVARFLVWTQAFEKEGTSSLARANVILRYCHRLGVDQLKAEESRSPGPFFPSPPGQAASWAANRSPTLVAVRLDTWRVQIGEGSVSLSQKL